MENQNHLQLQKIRSIAAVIRDGYQLYNGNFKHLFRRSWVTAIVYALCFAVMMSSLVNGMLPAVATLNTMGIDVNPLDAYYSAFTIKIMVGIGLFTLSALLLAAHGYAAMGEHRSTGIISDAPHWYGQLPFKSFLRLLMSAVWLLLLWLVIVAAFAALGYGIARLGVVQNIGGSVTTIALFMVLALIVGALLVPLTYSVMAQVLGTQAAWRPPFSGYAKGLRHWGLLFATTLVTALIASLLTWVCELPAIIIGMANVKAYTGAAMGDPLGIPDHLPTMTFIVFALAGFIQAYVHLYTIFPLYYAYGTIEAWHAERKALNIDTQTT